MKNPDTNLRRLTDAWHDGTISPEDALRLERRLLTDDTAVEYFLDIAEIEAEMAGAASKLPRAVPTLRPLRSAPRWSMAAVFVVGLFSGGLLLKSLPTRSTADHSPKPPAAMVTGMMGVSWAGQPDQASLALSADRGESKIGSGLIELTFASGTRAVVEGPATFQVLGNNAMSLQQGKLVADVPKGAEGFSVAYPDGKIVDLGTEFGVEVASGGRSANFGVFRGEIEFHPQGDAGRPVRLLENHAIMAENGTVVSVPFHQEKFTRKLPSREFAWEIKGDNPGPVVWDYDISHLIWKPGSYRAICKWMKGNHGLMIGSAELLLDGERVGEDPHPGFTGVIELTHDNSYEWTVPSNAYRRGRWTLRIHAGVDAHPGELADSAGVVLVEDGLAVVATAADFVGTWEYLHNGNVFRRRFLADGSANLTIDGEPFEAYAGSRWEVVGGNLILNVRDAGNDTWIRERHLLRDPRTLIFTNRPYRDATRVDE